MNRLKYSRMPQLAFDICAPALTTSCIDDSYDSRLMSRKEPDAIAELARQVLEKLESGYGLWRNGGTWESS